MARGEKRGDAYIEQAHERVRRYVQDLLRDNEQLRETIGKLHFELQRRERNLESLQGELARCRAETHRQAEDRAALASQLASIESQHLAFADRYYEIERENSNLANLYVSSYRLHGTLDRAEVLSVIQEIVVDLIGSEQLAVFETLPETGALELVAAKGLAPEQRGELGGGVIARTAATGQPYFADPADTTVTEGGLPLNACVPLLLDGRVVGVIAVFCLLPQKRELEPHDREIFDLLATHAATALYCTRLHQERSLATRESERIAAS